MSLSAQIRIQPPRELRFALLLIGGGGIILSLLTLLARSRAGSDVLLPGIFLVLVMVVMGLFWPRSVFVQTGFKIHEDGAIELEPNLQSEQSRRPSNKTIGTIRTDVLYRLTHDALFWPGLLILRLQAETMDEADASEKQELPVHTLLVMKSSLSESSYRVLARLLIWTQRKGVGDSFGASDLIAIPPHS